MELGSHQQKKKVKIGLFTGTRAEYGLLYPLVKALKESSDFEPSLYVSGSHLNPQYGNTLEEIQQDDLPIGIQFPLLTLGQNMAVESGLLAQQLGYYFQQPENRPDCVFLLGDRYETLAVGMATFLQNIPIAHIHGGDVVRGGMLDDPIRHAITKLAHLHFPVTQTSANRILAMGEEPWRVSIVGSPAFDNICLIPTLDQTFFTDTYDLDSGKPWILLTQHSITTQADLAGEQARQTLSAIASFGEAIQVIATYPNHDQGSQAIIDQLENFRQLPQFRVVKSLGRVQYLNMLRYAAVVVGNSSSGLLETAHFKVPCLNIGVRQKDRERGENVLDVAQDEESIRIALHQVLYDASFRQKLKEGQHPFGQGNCAANILEVLRKTSFDQTLLQKQLIY